jgi:GDP-L-fucose synthase
VIWGTGNPLREFLYVDDMADALLHLMRRYDGDGMVNIGSGEEISIAELARTIADVIGYRGELAFDACKPDGTPRKRLDTTRLDALQWCAQIRLRDGLFRTWRDRHDNAGKDRDRSQTPQ